MTARASNWERLKARELSSEILTGRLRILEGVRALVSLAHTDAIENQEDRNLIIGIDSETDHLPIGAVRDYWSEDALRDKDVEIARYEQRCEDQIFQVCRRIVSE